MNKTILVIGSVTAEQYQDARLSVLQRGDKPKVLRTSFEEFFLGSQQLIQAYASAQEKAEEARRAQEDSSRQSEQETQDLLHRLSVAHYGTFGDIGAFVVDETTWSRWDSSSYGKVVWMDHARQQQPVYAYRWIAYQDGKVEFAG